MHKFFKNCVLQQILEFYNKTYTERYGSISENSLTIVWSLTTAIFIPGGMLGAFLGGWIADKIGRCGNMLQQNANK